MPTTVHDDAGAELAQTVGPPPFGIDVVLHSGTTGSGTLADPYTGWTGQTFLAHQTYYFRPHEYYACAAVVDWAKEGIIINGNGARILCSGAGYISIEKASGIVTAIRVEGLILQGDGSTPACLKIKGVTDSYFGDIMIGDCVTVGCDLKFVITSVFERVRVSVNSGYYSVMPVDGIVLDQRDAIEDCIANVFIDCNLEGMSGAGFKFVKSSLNRIVGGTSEANGYGVYATTSANNRHNTIDTVHMEQNSIDDIYCTASGFYFINVSSGGSVKIGDGGILAENCTFMGGRYAGAITITGNHNVIHNDVIITGTLTDNSTTTRYPGSQMAGFARAQEMQVFLLDIVNTAGTIQHRIIGERQTATASAYARKITGASNVLANTPSVSSVVGFTSGGGIDSTGTSRFVFDVAAQTDAKFGAMTMIETNTTATGGIRTRSRNISANVNGVVRNRFAIQFVTDPGGVAHAISTANIGAGEFIQVKIMVFLE